MTHCWAPLVALRYATLAGFGPDQASPQHAPLVGAALVALAGTEHPQAPFVGAALVALRYAALAGFRPYQARPQHAPLVGAALVALARSGHQQAHGWAALVTPVHQGCWSCWQDLGQVSNLAPS